MNILGILVKVAEDEEASKERPEVQAEDEETLRYRIRTMKIAMTERRNNNEQNRTIKNKLKLSFSLSVG